MDQEIRLGMVLNMEAENKDRRRYGRGGLFSQIEDATYRVLRKAEKDAAGIQEALATITDLALPSAG